MNFNTTLFAYLKLNNNFQHIPSPLVTVLGYKLYTKIIATLLIYKQKDAKPFSL